MFLLTVYFFKVFPDYTFPSNISIINKVINEINNDESECLSIEDFALYNSQYF